MENKYEKAWTSGKDEAQRRGLYTQVNRWNKSGNHRKQNNTWQDGTETFKNKKKCQIYRWQTVKFALCLGLQQLPTFLFQWNKSCSIHIWDTDPNTAMGKSDEFSTVLKDWLEQVSKVTWCHFRGDTGLQINNNNNKWTLENTNNLLLTEN